MKYGKIKSILVALSGLVSVSASADTYRFSIAGRQPGKVIQAQNCLAYLHCVSQDTDFGAGKKYSLSTTLDLSVDELNRTLDACRFDLMDAQVKIFNLSKNENVDSRHGERAETFTSQHPNLYFVKISQAQKNEKVAKVKSKLKRGDKVGAIGAVFEEYGLDPLGYAFALGGDMGSAGAVTGHEEKLIKIADASFKHPCTLVQTIRHELEHAEQWLRAQECNSKHHFAKHVQRERSAYLNDIRLLQDYCPIKDWVNYHEDFSIQNVKKKYSENGTD